MFEKFWCRICTDYNLILIDYNCLCFGEFGQGYVVSLLGFLIANACLRFKVQTGVFFFCLYFLTLRKYLFLNFFQIYECVEKSKNHNCTEQ